MILPKCANTFPSFATGGPATRPFTDEVLVGRRRGSIVAAVITTVVDESRRRVRRSAAGSYSR